MGAPGEKMIRDQDTLDFLVTTVSRFVDEVLIPHENDVAETDEIPESVIAAMRELGLFGLTIPEEFGAGSRLARLPLLYRDQQRHRVARHSD
jgi:alkylation response protein AidB-like acyl-CoA dehydrogenase